MRLALAVASVLCGCFVDATPGGDPSDTDDATTTTSSPTTTVASTTSTSGEVTTAASDDATTDSADTTGGSSESTASELGRFGSAVWWKNGCAEEAAPANSLIFGGAPFTVEFWLQIRSPTEEGWQMLVYRGGNSPSSAPGWTIELVKVNDDQYQLQMCGGTPELSGQSCVASTQLLEVGSPYHVAVVRTPPGNRCLAGKAGCARLYIAAAGSIHALTEGELGFDWIVAAPLRLASGDASCTSYPAQVVMDELRIWSVALTGDQLDAQQDDVLMCDTPDLAAYYGFDSADSNALLDCTGNAVSVIAVPEYELVDSPFDE